MVSKLTLKLHHLAEKELEEALDWYNDISPSLSNQFFSAFELSIKIALDFPEIYPVRFGCRTIVLTRFPYLIFYLVQADELVVLAIFHGYRNPSTIIEELGGR